MWVNLPGYEHHAYKPVLKASFQQPSYYFDLFNGFRILISGGIPAGSRTHDTFVFRANPHR